MAEYKDTREGLLVEYSEKILAECGIDPNSTTVQDKLHKHFVRGLISDIIDRVIEKPKQYKD